MYGPHRCLRRNESPNPNAYIKEGVDVNAPDEWRDQGKDKCCTYCGSWHPEQFKEFLKEVIAKPDDISIRMEVSDKKYKIYAHRPGVSNAGDGAIKFYMMHAPHDPADPKMYESEFIDLLNEANKISQTKWHHYFREFKKDLEKSGGIPPKDDGLN